MNTILEANNLKFQDILAYPDIRIEQNKATFLCGESGCGKSTLLKLFNSTISPSDGKILYNGQNISDIDTIKLRKEVLLVSQSIFLFDGSIQDNFRQYYSYRGVPLLTGEDMKKYLSLCCTDFELTTKCETMSGGERQRVFIAVCLSFLPKVLMLDEPTSALDSTTANRFFKQIKQFCTAQSITLIVISHDNVLADTFADAKIILKKAVSS